MICRREVRGTVAAVAIGGLGMWTVRHSQEERRFNELMDGLAEKKLRS
jgi:hypothetical protein